MERCTECGAATTAGETHCQECGFPREWQVGEHVQEGGDDSRVRPRLPDESAAPTTQALRPVAITPSSAPTVSLPIRDQSSSTGGIPCLRCNERNDPSRVLCVRCGEPLEDDESREGDARGTTSDTKDSRSKVWVILAIVGTIGLLGGGGLWWLGRPGAETTEPDGDSSADISPTETPGPPDQSVEAAAGATPSALDLSVVLSRGETGEDVREWQAVLQQAGLDVVADGVFGPATEQATRDFQRMVCEPATGNVTVHARDWGERIASLVSVQIVWRDGPSFTSTPRLVPQQMAADAALAALAVGPCADEEASLSTALSAGTTFSPVVLVGSTASVGVEGLAVGGGAAQVLERRVTQIVDTLTSLETIDRVLLQLPESDRRLFSDAGIDLSAPIGG